MGQTGIQRTNGNEDSAAIDPVVRAYRRTRSAVQSSQKHLHAQKFNLAAKAIKETAIAGREFVQAIPLTKRGIALKIVAALKSLEDAGDDEAADMIRTFFISRKTVDGEWLHDLRHLCNGVKIAASQPALAVECLKSILAAKTRPRQA